MMEAFAKWLGKGFEKALSRPGGRRKVEMERKSTYLALLKQNIMSLLAFKYLLGMYHISE